MERRGRIAQRSEVRREQEMVSSYTNVGTEKDALYKRQYSNTDDDVSSFWSC